MALHVDILTLPGIEPDAPEENPVLRSVPTSAPEDAEYLFPEVKAAKITLPKTPSVTKLAAALARNGLPEQVAEAIARAVTDPAAVRNRLSAANIMRVPGAELLAVEATVFAPAVAPYLANPRAASSWQFPVAGDGATRPLCGVISASGSTAPELLVDADSPEHVAEVLSTNAAVLTGTNDYRDSIAAQGVLRPVLLTALTVTHADGTQPACILTAVDGSSRVTACHELLGLLPKHVFYPMSQSPKALRREVERHVKLAGDDPTDQQKAALRALEIPATIIVGFRPSDPRVDFATAIKSLLGLIHVDPPRPWGPEGTLDAQADSVIATLLDEGHLDEATARWFLGMLSPADAAAAGFSPLQDERFATIMLTLLDPDLKRSVNRGKSRLSISTTKVGQRERVSIVVELALRSVRHRLNDEKVDRARSALNRAMELGGLFLQFKNELAAGEIWEVTGRSPDELLAAALLELKSGAGWTARRELGVLGVWWLTTRSALLRSKHRATDPREPSVLLRGLMTSEQGLRILHRAVLDGRAGREIALVNEAGEVERSASGEIRLLNDDRLRAVITIEDEGVVPEVRETAERIQKLVLPTERLRVGSQRLVSLADQLQAEMAGISEICETDGSKVAERFGIETGHVERIKLALDSVREDLTYYGRVWTKYRDSHQAKFEDDEQ